MPRVDEGEEAMAKDSKRTRLERLPLRTGVVTSTGGAKTIHVTVENLTKHPRYSKYIRRRTKLAVHDAKEQASLGDLVEIVPCRRVSKSKSWRLVRVVRSAEALSGSV